MTECNSFCLTTLSRVVKTTINYFTTCKNIDTNRKGYYLYKLKNDKTKEEEETKETANDEEKIVGNPFKLGNLKKMAAKGMKAFNNLKDPKFLNGLKDKFTLKSPVEEEEDKEEERDDTGEEILVLSESDIIFVGEEYEKGIKDKIEFKNLKGIVVKFPKIEDTDKENKGTEDVEKIIFKGVSEYDIKNPESKLNPNKDCKDYVYQITNSYFIANRIKSLIDAYYTNLEKENENFIFKIPTEEEKKNFETAQYNKTMSQYIKTTQKEEKDLKNDLKQNKDENKQVQFNTEEEENQASENEEDEEGDNAENDEDKHQIIEYGIINENDEKYKNYASFRFNDYKFILPKYYEDDLIVPGNYYLTGKQSKKKKDENNEEGEFKTKISLFIPQEQQVEILQDNSTLNSLKYQAFDNMKYYLSKTIEDLGLYYSQPLKKVRKITPNEDACIFKGYKTEIRTKPDETTKNGLKIMYYFLRRKFIPPFHETFNDIIIIVIENYSSDKGNFYFSNETVETVDTLIKSLAPMDVKVGNSITRKMIEKKIETFLVDGKALKFYKTRDFENKYSMLPSPLKNGKPFDLENITKLSNDFRIKLKTYYKDYSSIHDFSVDFDPEIEDILLELGIHMRLEDYEKDLKYRSYKEIIDFPLKTYDKLFAKKDAQDQILFESKVSFFLSQILVERVFGNDILKDVLDLAVKKSEFLNHIRDVLNFLVNFRIMDYDHQIKKDVEIPYIIEHKNEVKELFFNEKFLSLLISRNLLKDLQNVTSQVTYFKFLTFILQNKFSLKIFISICDYLELLKNESPQIKAAGDIISNESESIPTIIKNTSVILTSILNIFYTYKENPIITTIATKCLQNLILLDYENAKYFDQSDFYSILGEHLLSSDQSVVFNAIYLLVLLTSQKYDQTKVIGGNKSLLYRLLNIFRGIKVANHSFHPEVILLLLKYFSRLIRNNSIKEILESDNNRKFIKYILRYLYNYESSFDVDDDCNLYYFDIHSALFKFLYNYVDQDAESKKYLENNFKIISLVNRKCVEFNYIIDQVLAKKKENLLLTSLLENSLNFLREYTGNDKNRSNEYQKNANNVILFIRKSQAYGTMLKNICKEKKIDEKKEIKNINKRCQELEKCYKDSD